MKPISSYTFKIATHPSEFQQIHRLNYQTFVEEIPQHPPNPNQRLVDRFHQENIYFICLNSNNTLLGMMALRSQRPFSLDQKIDDLFSYLPKHQNPFEARLLAIIPTYRRSTIIAGLLISVIQYATRHGCDLLLISGVFSQHKLYRKLGFLPFGPVVMSRSVPFQPMYLKRSYAQTVTRPHLHQIATHTKPSSFLNLLPGPVDLSETVQSSLQRPLISHRSSQFQTLYMKTKQQLSQFVHARKVAICVGNGTLANDIVASQLSLLPGKGIILSNGEFGDRLIDHGKRFQLQFEEQCTEWGQPINLQLLRQQCAAFPDLEWVWFVHCETSTGMLNDFSALQMICREYGLKLCADCISSLGLISLNLQDVYLATGVSGKALAAPPGLAMVFYNHQLQKEKPLPRSLDLNFYDECPYPPFTTPSNLLYALSEALTQLHLQRKQENINRISHWLRKELQQRKIHCLVPAKHSNPAILTIPIPAFLSSEILGIQLENQGFIVHYKSRYLLQRNWIQICLFSDSYHSTPFLPFLNSCQQYWNTLTIANSCDQTNNVSVPVNNLVVQ